VNGPALLQERIGKLILDGINVEVPSVDTDLFDTGVLDSLAFVELLLHLEREFGVQISIEELEIERFRSIERIAEFIASQVGSAAAPSGEWREPSAGSGNGAGSGRGRPG